jgi:molybdopterin synthase catalytic subunit
LNANLTAFGNNLVISCKLRTWFDFQIHQFSNFQIDTMFAITDQDIDIQSVIKAAESDQAGAIDVFIGTVRDNSVGKKVVRLEYEAFDSMAIKKMKELADEAARRWKICGVSIVHRKGVLNIGDVAVVLAVSTPHRAESFEACKWLIDTLKQVVPVWKKEVYEDGEVWVAAHA